MEIEAEAEAPTAHPTRVSSAVLAYHKPFNQYDHDLELKLADKYRESSPDERIVSSNSRSNQS